MRKLMLIAAPLALVACSEQAEVEEQPAEAAEVVAVTTANGSGAGTYEISNDEGPQGTSIMNADGTFQDMDSEGNVIAEGSFAVVDGKTCFTPTTEGVDPMCWVEGEVGEDGSFTATSDAGEVVTVKLVAQ